GLAPEILFDIGDVRLSASEVVCDGDTSCTGTSPASAAQSAVIYVRINGVTGSRSPTNFSYDPPAVPAAPPTVTAFSPSHGPATGGTRVTITGTGFTSVPTLGIPPQVLFESTPATDVVCVSDTTCIATSPGGRAEPIIYVIANNVRSLPNPAGI